MNHPAELALHQYMENAVKGNATMSKETMDKVLGFGFLRQRT